jgi:2-phospho-L-lactate guanylyltransferase
VRWTVLLPVKSLPDAKGRLVDASPDADAHAQLVAAIRADTVAAARAAASVARLVLVTDRPADGELVFVQRTPGLNAALAEAAADAAARWPEDGVAALVGDLPALRPGDLGDALQAAATHPRAFVRDAAGTGTTMLTASPGVELRPAFGPESAARHGTDASELDAAPALRCDVDTGADLDAAAGLGLGPHTAAVLGMFATWPRAAS